MTLSEDFNIWWNMAKYKEADIPAREHGDVLITTKHGSNYGWPGEEKEVKYWVELANGMAVGVLTPKKGAATFPMYPLNG